MLIGARRIGKTALLQKLAASLPAPYLWMNGEDFATAELLARRTEANYRQLLGEKRILLIDEAQKIPEIGWILKLMVDTLPGIQEREGKAAYLSELVHSYLLKDIFYLEGIRSANKIKDLLRLLAFQVGEEVSTGNGSSTSTTGVCW